MVTQHMVSEGPDSSPPTRSWILAPSVSCRGVQDGPYDSPGSPEDGQDRSGHVPRELQNGSKMAQHMVSKGPRCRGSGPKTALGLGPSRADR
eukprot:6338475-Pyramimonas_sp.AAC.1